MKIDLVYLFVDSSDEEWVKKKNNTLAHEKKIVPDYSKDICRWKNNGELKYALRSAEKHAPWINHIYIVTDNQIPEWLNTDNSKISIVDHKQILPESVLPTFNSNAILHNIVNIPGLSEYFLYSDDDMYFGKDVTPDFFFTKDGKPICRFDQQMKNVYNSIWKQSLINAANCLKAKKYKFPLMRMHHNIDGYKKSIILDCSKEFSEEISSTIKEKFRTENDIERIIYSYYAVATKQGKFVKTYAYKNNKPLYKRIFKQIFKGSKANESAVFSYHLIGSGEKIENYEPMLFCINDTILSTDKDRCMAINEIEKIFPEKSSFEK